ncbi:SPFH domain-containing protein [Lactovum odontotermitis]
MGIIKAAIGSVGGALADQWVEVIEPEDMGAQTVMTKGVAVRQDDKRSSNKKGTADIITDGSVIHINENTMMLLVDGGKIVDFSAEPGYYQVKNASAPSLLRGNLSAAIDESFDRFKYGGVSPQKQQVFYINLQEIKGIKFGTATPLQYFDNFYNAELFLRTFGSYSVKITDPVSFYINAIPKNMDQVEISDINEQYVSEFMSALNTAINQFSAQGERISYITSKSVELGKMMSEVLDDDWKKLRGIEIVSVAVASISYTDDSQKLINMRNQGAMLGDPNIREGYVQGAVAAGLQAAGSNPNGAAGAFMAMNMGAQNLSGFSQFNQAQAAQQQQAPQQPQQPQPAAPVQPAASSWTCSCGTENTGKFCSNCGKPKPADTGTAVCSSCGATIDTKNGMPKFCPECGQAFIAKQ